MPQSTSDDPWATTRPGEYKPAQRRAALPSALTLVIAWYPSAPERVGELAIAPSGERAMILGRGAVDSEPRMLFVRPRPGKLESVQPLAASTLSRRQLEFQATSSGLSVRNVGRCPMRVNGQACEAGERVLVREGDTLGIGQELVLVCVRRPVSPAPLQYWPHAARHVFGQVDPLGMLGESPAIWRLRDEIAFAAASRQHVLITGKSGCGKELAARALHQLSPRGSKPFVARNAATLPPGLIDAELFGNVRNYPNPGSSERAGLIGSAHEGVLMLDEIGELSVELQSHLLRVLDAGGEYQRLGEASVRRSDLLLVAATNRDPSELRQDLLTRLTVRVHVPELAERVEDIALLVRHIVLEAARTSPKLAERYVGSGVRIDAELIEHSLRGQYPGNTRDLSALIWRAMSQSTGDVISLPSELIEHSAAAKPAAALPNREPSDEEITQALAAAGGSISRAASLLELSSRYALYRLISKRGLALPTRD